MNAGSGCLIAAIVPPHAVAAEALGDAPETTLLPEEEAALGRAAEVRRREFATSRWLARRALAALGVPASPILPGPNREPMWPQGVVGSITHCRGYCAAVVAPAARMQAVGIDAEVHAPLPAGVLPMVARDDEQEWIKAREGDGIWWECLLFSAKEAVFKAWFPLTNRWLGFHDVRVTIAPDAQRFHAHFLVDPPRVDGSPIAGFDGCYRIERGYVLTAVHLARFALRTTPATPTV